MTNIRMVSELQAIERELDEILSKEQDAARELDRRFAEEQGAIEKLLLSVEEAKLDHHWRNTRFGMFDVLGRPRLEEAHSSFLAWLLDPAEAHGFGGAFLREFMRRTVGNEPPSTVELSVSREFRCGDLRFDIYVKGERWRLIVENKIDAEPSGQQSINYQEYCRKVKSRGEQAWLVYVTPAWRPFKTIPWLSYREVRSILDTLTPDPSAVIVIEQFCHHIMSELEA